MGRRAAIFVTTLSLLSLASCAAILSLPDPALDDGIGRDGASSGGVVDDSGSEDAHRDDAPSDGGLPEIPPPPEGKPLWSSIFTPGGEHTFVACDSTGNVILAREFSGQLTFGTTTLTAVNDDVAIVKLGASGAVLWAKQITGTGNERINGLSVDTNGDVYVAGLYDGNLDAAGATETSGPSATPDGYVAKLRGSDGTGAWANRFALTASDAGIHTIHCSAVRATPAGIAFACPFRGTVTASKGLIRSLTTRYGSLVGLLSPLNGNVVQSVVLSSPVAGADLGDQSIVVSAVDVDASGSLYAFGRTRADSILVDTTLLPNSHKKTQSGQSADAFVVKVKSTFTLGEWAAVWATALPIGMRADRENGGVYFTGWFGSADFGFGNAMSTSPSGISAYVVKLAASGVPSWQKIIEGASPPAVGNVDVDRWGRPILGLYMPKNSAMTVDGVAIPAGNVMLAAKLDQTNGRVLAARSFVPSGQGAVHDIATCPASGNAVMSGYLTGTVELETTRTSTANNDIYVVALSP